MTFTISGGLHYTLLAKAKSRFKWHRDEFRRDSTRYLSLARSRILMLSSKPITGDAPAVVCLTSHGRRMQYVHYTILSIANGTLRPKRIILWIGHDDAHLITSELRSLQQRGVEIILTEDYGPHTKYYPYCIAGPDVREADVPMIIADDDIIYPTRWLADLIRAEKTEPYPVVVAHRAHRIELDKDGVSPYQCWGLERGTVEPSFANVATGVCGVLYPPEFVSQISRIGGREFMDTARTADDLWLHTRAVSLRIPTKQIRQQPPMIVEHHSAYQASLSQINVTEGKNDEVIKQVYTPRLISIIRATPPGPDR